MHGSNPIDELSDEALRDICTGRVQNWKDVGGHDAPITFISRAEGRSELKMMLKYLRIEATDVEAGAIAGENQQAVKQVETDENALSFLSVGTSESMIASGSELKMLRLRGVEASSATVAAGDFPWSRPLILVTPKNPSPRAAAFVEFARSNEHDDIIESHSFVPATN